MTSFLPTSGARPVAALLCFAAVAAAQAPKLDPTAGEVSLPAAPGWTATLVLENDVGVWTTGSAHIFPAHGCPEVYGLDDRGRFVVCVSYSGKWTPFQTTEDREWLGAVARVDLDPRIPGAESYVGGKRGNIYRVVALEGGGFDATRVARLPGAELNTFAAGDLLPARPGAELLAFAFGGAVYDVRPPEAAGGDFTAAPLDVAIPGVRDVVVLPSRDGGAPWAAVVSRTGRIELLRMNGRGVDRRVVGEEPMGCGRIARRRVAAGAPEVLYATRDDGVVLRFAEGADGAFAREVAYVGPQGPRGIAAGRFAEDPAAETIAVFGYSKRVELLTRSADGRWSVSPVFEDRAAGHWLAAAELDGRNGCDELLCSGFGGRIVQIARPAGFAAPPKAAVDPSRAAPAPVVAGPTRVAVRAAVDAPSRLSPLSYRGGFEPKTFVYETLVRRDPEGRLAPGLATRWTPSADGATWRLALREGATFHDGAPADAEAVRLHLRRWLGFPEHRWIGAARYVRDVRVVGPAEIEVVLDRPYAFVPDLCAINPTAVQGPGALDGEGEFTRPVGSGTFRVERRDADGRTIRLRRAAPGEGATAELDLVLCDRGGESAKDALFADRADVAWNGWSREFMPEDVDRAARDPRFEVIESPGSAVVVLAPRLNGGATADVALRRAVAGSLDRSALVRAVERGRGTPCPSLFAPTVRVWPDPPSAATRPAVALARPTKPLRLLARADDASEVATTSAAAAQLVAAGIPAEAAALDADAFRAALAAGDYDYRLWTTWGVPYDPFLTLRAAFLPREGVDAAAGGTLVTDARLVALVEAASAEPDQDRRSETYGRIEALLREDALLTPLLAPHRVAIVRRGAPKPRLDHDLYRVAFP